VRRRLPRLAPEAHGGLDGLNHAWNTAWYVATLLDDAGVRAVVDAALDEHGLAGPLRDEVDLDVVERVCPDGTRHAFVLNHGDERTVRVPFDGTDLLTGRNLRSGEVLALNRTAVLVVRLR
jgi:beta-galactosidase